MSKFKNIVQGSEHGVKLADLGWSAPGMMPNALEIGRTSGQHQEQLDNIRRCILCSGDPLLIDRKLRNGFTIKIQIEDMMTSGKSDRANEACEHEERSAPVDSVLRMIS